MCCGLINGLCLSILASWNIRCLWLESSLIIAIRVLCLLCCSANSGSSLRLFPFLQDLLQFILNGLRVFIFVSLVLQLGKVLVVLLYLLLQYCYWIEAAEHRQGAVIKRLNCVNRLQFDSFGFVTGYFFHYGLVGVFQCLQVWFDLLCVNV